MATTKQVKFLKSLMVERGYAHPRGFLRGAAADLPHGPSMRQRQGTVEDWASRLSVREASDVIGALLTRK